MINIIVVEDEFVNALLIKEMLKSYNFNLIHFEDGTNLLEFIQTNTIDLILMDIRLPKGNGFDLTKKIKTIYPKLPIIAQTAYAFETDRQKAKEVGCDDFIAKPINKMMLVNTLRKFIKI